MQGLDKLFLLLIKDTLKWNWLEICFLLRVYGGEEYADS